MKISLFAIPKVLEIFMSNVSYDTFGSFEIQKSHYLLYSTTQGNFVMSLCDAFNTFKSIQNVLTNGETKVSLQWRYVKTQENLA